MSSAKRHTLGIFSLLLISAVFSVSFASTPTKDSDSLSQAITDIYQQMIEAYASLNPQIMANAYTSDGYYVSTGKNNTIAHGTTELNALYHRYFTKIKQNNFHLNIEFKVIDRLIDSRSVTDIGYYLVSVIPALDGQQPIKQHAGKFMITFKKDQEQRWRMWSDANNRVSVDTYNNAKMIESQFYAAKLTQLSQPALQCQVNNDIK